MFLLPLAHAEPLVVDRFDTAEPGAPWKTAQLGSGPASKGAVEDGAYVLRAEPRTKRFTTLVQKHELRGVSWLKVDARIKTDGGPASVTIRFEDGPLLHARSVTGTTDWTAYTRYIQVPVGARDVSIGLLLSGAGTAAFDDLVVGPVDPGWKVVTKGRFVWHHLPTDIPGDTQFSKNDENYERIVAALGVAPTTVVEYHKYPSLAAKVEYTGVEGNAHVEGNKLHTIFRADEHELTHILARALGDPPPMLYEGLAVYLSGEWEGKDVRQSTRALVAEGKAPALAELLDAGKFRALPEGAAYTVSAAFLKWVGTRDPALVKQLYAQTKASVSAAANQKVIETLLGMSLTEAEAAFRSWV